MMSLQLFYSLYYLFTMWSKKLTFIKARHTYTRISYDLYTLFYKIIVHLINDMYVANSWNIQYYLHITIYIIKFILLSIIF